MKAVYAAMALLVAAPAGMAQEQAAAPVVSVQAVEKREVPNVSEFIGRIQAVERVEIEVRVTGTLLKPQFTEGDRVKSGQLLYEIDPPPFQADVAAKEAQLASAKALAANADIMNQRAQALLARNTGTRADADTQAANLAAANANVQIAQADLDMSNITLGYTRITAPIDGRVGRNAITEGNIVSPGSGPLTTIVKDDEVWAVFAPSQREVLQYRKAAFTKPPVAHLKLADGSIYSATGTIDYIDNTTDPNTDSQVLRATFANPDNLLVDGQTIRVRIE